MHFESSCQSEYLRGKKIMIQVVQGLQPLCIKCLKGGHVHMWTCQVLRQVVYAVQWGSDVLFTRT